MSSRDVVTSRIVHCDFCGQPSHAVDQMIQGPNDIAICKPCVMLCLDIISEADDKLQATLRQKGNYKNYPFTHGTRG